MVSEFFYQIIHIIFLKYSEVFFIFEVLGLSEYFPLNFYPFSDFFFLSNKKSSLMRIFELKGENQWVRKLNVESIMTLYCCITFIFLSLP